MKKSNSISFLLTTVGLLLFAALYAYSFNTFWNEGTTDLGAHFEWYESLLNSDFSGSILNNVTVLAWLTLFIGIKIILMRQYHYPFLAFAQNLKIYF